MEASMPRSQQDSKYRVERAAARQDKASHRLAPASLGKRYALLLGMLVLAMFLAVWLGGADAAWATSPVSPVTGISSGDASSGSVFWARLRAAFSWRSPLPWFLIGLPGLGLLSWGLLWGLSRLEAANKRRSESDQEIFEA
jgi:hypothetical protein